MLSNSHGNRTELCAIDLWIVCRLLVSGADDDSQVSSILLHFCQLCHLHLIYYEHLQFLLHYFTVKLINQIFAEK